MGCINSTKESSDLHPNVFRVVNIDEHGADLCSGQLEITDTDIVLFREGRDSTVWPLHSLRRYGFEGEIFSFESGRRCDTGEGIYAFRCRRASALFRALQNRIQQRNIVSDSVPYPVSHMHPSPQGRQTLQASVVHRSSIDNGLPDRSNTNGNIATGQTLGVERNANQTMRSPSSADILEVTPLYPSSQTTSHASNVYQLRDFKREHNNNNTGAGSPAEPVHLYTNDFNRDLAILRNSLKQEAGLMRLKAEEDESYFMQSRYMNGHFANNLPKSPLSPTPSSTSEHYAQLTLEQQESARYYINVQMSDKSMHDVHRSEQHPSSPTTPTGKQVEYCNLSLGVKQDINTYANLSLGELRDTISSEHHHKYTDCDPFTSMSPVEELEVNYAVLDIGSDKETPPNQSYTSPKEESIASGSSQNRGFLVSQSSVDKSSTPNNAPLPTAKNGYTTIDFDKTVALTSVAADADVGADGPRKTRHNSCNIVCGSPVRDDKNKST